ncbi:MAG: DNA repair protein RecO [Myxococcales bacterium]|nr:DNA repair protein RecO [Myxococcales bacterium]
MRDPGRQVVAIVLSVSAYADDDRILKVLTPTEGKVGAFQRMGRRRPAGLDVGVGARLRLRRGHEGGLDTLVDANVDDPRIHLRSGYGRLALAQYGCQLVGALAREDHAEPKQFGLLDTWLVLLDALHGDPDLSLVAALELKALTFAGVGPALDRCGACGGPVEAMMHLEPSGGGAVHARCGGGLLVAAPVLAELERLRRTPLRELVDATVDPLVVQVAADLVRGHLGHELASRQLLVGLC